MIRRRRAVRREETLACIDLDGRRLDYLLKRSSARRSVSLKVNNDGQAQVNAPWSMHMARIEQFLLGHADWLREQLRRRQRLSAWHDGMSLPYLGGELRLAWRRSANLRAVHEQPGALCCLAPEDRIEAVVVDWYRRQAESVLATHLSRVCRGIGFPLPPWRLSDARTRWGSLSAEGKVSLNWRLIKADPGVIDYVICHELAHFRHRNHSPSFWREVERLCPGHALPRDRLRRDGTRYLEF